MDIQPRSIGRQPSPLQFFYAFNYSPPIIGFASIGDKDSLKNIRETGEFCWNLVSENLVKEMNQTSVSAPSHVDEFELSGLDKQASKIISVPHVKEAKVIFECRSTQISQLQNLQGEELNTWLILGEVVGVHIDRTLINNGLFDTLAAKPVLRGVGPSDYFGISKNNKFELLRPEF